MRTLCLLLLTVFTCCIAAQAQWDSNPATVYNPICTAPTNELYAYTISDGAGGIIAVWTENDFSGNAAGVYCQHKTSDGALAWGDSSTTLILANSFPAFSSVSLVDVQADKEGGAYITWNITQSLVSKLYVQHINNNGVVQYAPGGMQMVPVQGNYAYGGKISADSSGFFICWSEQIVDFESPVPVYAEVLVQRYNKAGQAQWQAPITVSDALSKRFDAQMVSDSDGGVFIAFTDSRNSSFDSASGNADNLDIYAQHISSNGNRWWQQDVPVTIAPYNQFVINDGGSEMFSSMLSDSAGGFILMFNNKQDEVTFKNRLYAQRINSNGNSLWAAGGLQVFPDYESAAFSILTQVLSDGANGLVATLDVNYFSGYSDIYAQRITAVGNKQWGDSAIKINPAMPGGGFNSHSNLVADGTGSFVAAWTNRLEFAIKAQKINANGALQWHPNGMDVCTNQYAVPSQPVLAKSDSNTVIAVWGDQRNSFIGNESDLYAAKINNDGLLVFAGIYVTVMDGNWGDAATWQANKVPPAGADVLVRHNVTGNVNAACKSLTIQQPGGLTVLEGVDITVK